MTIDEFLKNFSDKSHIYTKYVVYDNIGISSHVFWTKGEILEKFGKSIIESWELDNDEYFHCTKIVIWV